MTLKLRMKNVLGFIQAHPEMKPFLAFSSIFLLLPLPSLSRVKKVGLSLHLRDILQLVNATAGLQCL